MKRERSFVILLCFFVGMRMLALETKALVLNFKDGRQWSVFFERKPVVSFSGSTIVVTGQINNASVKLISCDRSEISDYCFEKRSADDVTAIGKVSKEELKMIQEGDVIYFYGLTGPGNTIKVFDLNGKAYPAAASSDGTSAQVRLTGIPKGIYVVKIDKSQSIKIIKK